MEEQSTWLNQQKRHDNVQTSTAQSTVNDNVMKKVSKKNFGYSCSGPWRKASLVNSLWRHCLLPRTRRPVAANVLTDSP